MTIEPWVYSPLFAVDHYSTSSTASLKLIKELEFHIHSSNVPYANKYCAVCLSLPFPSLTAAWRAVWPLWPLCQDEDTS